MCNATRDNIVEVNASFFYEKFKENKDKKTIEHTERVLLRELKFYEEECSCFLMTDDFAAGLALEKSGRIVSVFKGDSKYGGVGKVLLDEAIDRGGCKLECNDVEQLRHIYSVKGFVPVSKSPLDKGDIYYAELKEQENDVDHGTTLLFWVFNEKSKEEAKKHRNELMIHYANVKHFDSEQEAEEFRDLLLQKLRNNEDDEYLKEYLSQIIDYCLFS